MVDSQVRDRMKNIELNFTQNYGEIQKKVEMCTMSTQVVIHSQNFWNNIIKFSTEDDTDTEDLIYFYKNDIAGLEKLVNSNPYLYQIRVYIDSDKIPEMMPIVYRKDRMKNLSWAKVDFASGSWQYDFVDNIFPSYILRPEPHLVSYVTKMSELDYAIDATIEVTTKMETLFPDLYQSNEKEWTCFVDEKGYYYYNTDYHSKWLKNIDEIYSNMRDLGTSYSEEKVIDNTHVIICYKPLNELKGHLIKIVSIEDDINDIKTSRNIFWILFVLITIILMFLINKLVNIILKQFYKIINTIHIIQKGDLNIRVNDCENGEIGELGQQINKMLDRITGLMEDSIKRELLVKDSEIRALQNQINAHFIYNVLESIKMMAEIDEKYEISDAVTSLGKLLRYSMKWVSKNVTVEEEIDYIKHYLALMNLRFDYEIYLSLNIPERLYGQAIPKMTLQPIIENAIYHGIEGIAEDTNIYMKGIIYDTYCTIEITDSGKGMSEQEILLLQKKIDGEIQASCCSGNGIGLKNVQDRIKISFGDNYGISIASKQGCYTKVIVKIPLV
jgi:two-component system sensor histidine kinase YesM